jgi:hypothetical protein
LPIIISRKRREVPSCGSKSAGFVGGHFFQALVVVRQREHDDPWFVDLVSLEHIKRIHAGDADRIALWETANEVAAAASCSAGLSFCNSATGNNSG